MKSYLPHNLQHNTISEIKSIEKLARLEQAITDNATTNYDAVVAPDLASNILGVNISGVRVEARTEIDPVLDSRFYSGTVLPISRIKELRALSESVEQQGLKEIKANNLGDAPAMSSLDLAKFKYEEAVGRMQYNTKTGNENFLEFEFKHGPGTIGGGFLQGFINAGIISAKDIEKDKNNNTTTDLKISFTDLANAGFEIEDFEGWMDEKTVKTILSDKSEGKMRHFKSWFGEHS